MQTNDLLELVRKLERDSREQSGAAELYLPGLGTSDSSIATDVQRLATAGQRNPVVQPDSKRETASSEPDDSTAATVLKTIGMVTGVGPLVTGLVKLFGSGDSSSEPAALAPYSLPNRVSVEAGLAADRSFVPVSYSQSGVPRSSGTAAELTASATQIHVNVQAMDSRSFLDHSDDIARAVREAMLRSHSLNDVVSEL